MRKLEMARKHGTYLGAHTVLGVQDLNWAGSELSRAGELIPASRVKGPAPEPKEISPPSEAQLIVRRLRLELAKSNLRQNREREDKKIIEVK